MRRIALLLLSTSALLLVGLAPSAGAATYTTAVGIGDQSPTMFTNPSFTALNIKKVRYFIPWDAASRPDQLALADAYVAAAKKANVKVLLHISTNDLRPKIGKLPSQAQYKTQVGKLIKRYRAKGVKEWGAWNEVNHKSQETWNNPGAAAKFFLTMRTLCKGCTIVALDILDQAGSTNYIAKWYKALGRKNYLKASVVGIHNYSDTNRSRSSGTSAILKKVKSYNRRTNFWLTETGGLAGFAPNFPCDPVRQAKAVKYMFTLTKKFRKDVDRLYSYNFFGTTEDQCQQGLFDAGLVTSDGIERPAYAVFKTAAASFAR